MKALEESGNASDDPPEDDRDDSSSDSGGDTGADSPAENEDNEHDNEVENEDDERNESQDAFPNPSGPANGSLPVPPTSHPHPTLMLTSPSPHHHPATPAAAPSQRPSVRPEALTARVYDIVPTIAAPHSTSINAITATPDLRWLFTGGADGYIRKFNWIDTANGKVMLTVAQRHPFVDSVTKAGVLMSYWENEEPQIKSPFLNNADDNLSLSPVYSLSVESQGLWLLSGLDSGSINLQSVRHDEGKRITYLRKHTSAVSVLALAGDEKSVLSGSWDKTVYDWDLNTGQVKRGFIGSGGQISAIEQRPLSSLPVPKEAAETPVANGTLSDNNAEQAQTNGVPSSAASWPGRRRVSTNQAGDGANAASPTDSLFGNDADSLFGDHEDISGPGAPSGGAFGDDEDDEFSRAIANGIQQQGDEGAQDDTQMPDAATVPDLLRDIPPVDAPTINGQHGTPSLPNGVSDIAPPALTNGLPHADTVLPSSIAQSQPATNGEMREAPTDDTFLAASFDGTIRIWDRRQPEPVSCILPRNVPPWCMNACWSPDGNHLYAGRRNGTVEEFSLHKGLRTPERTFKFPNGSGPVSAVKAMPNGQHLICASFDILRLYDLKEQQAIKHSTVPFLIVPGHRGGVISSLYIDPTCRYLISTAGNRGWEGSTTEVVLGYEIGVS
ncbi:MAG: Transcription factor spt8 [Caeruleum heppii]|nr:MAG: Transcription factor spt8 [Caeruleum heppii]